LLVVAVLLGDCARGCGAFGQGYCREGPKISSKKMLNYF